MNSKAIVTLAVGEKHSTLFKKYCYKNWSQYSEKFGYDLIVFDRLIDTSERALSRSVAWQKCLVFMDPSIKKYKQVVWIDADILINSSASPSIVENIDIDKVGAVDCYSMPTPEISKFQHQQLYTYWESIGINFIDNVTPEKYYEQYGLCPGFGKVVQTGVMVVSPSHHSDIISNVYKNYEERRGSEWNYEMRPLSFELMRNGVVQWIDHRFNIVWSYEKLFHYPFINSKLRKSAIHEKLLRKMKINVNDRQATGELQRLCATSSYLNSFFLHFAGDAEEIAYVDTNVKSLFDLQ